MSAPDPAQPLDGEMDQGSLVVRVPRDPGRVILWTVRPDDPTTPVVIAELASRQEAQVWMVPYQAFATLTERDHPVLALSLYQALRASPHPVPAAPQAERPDSQVSSSLLPSGTRDSSDRLSRPVASPVLSERAEPEGPPAEPKRSIWTQSDLSPPVEEPTASPAIPFPPTAAAEPWRAGWLMQITPRAFSFWRWAGTHLDWVRQPDQQAWEWESVTAAWTWAEQQDMAPILWTPRGVLRDAHRTDQSAPQWYLGQLARDRFCLWHLTAPGGFAVLADRRKRLLLFPDRDSATAVGRTRGTVSIYTPSGVWKRFLELQAKTPRDASPPLSNGP